MILPWKKSCDHLDSILKSRGITFPTSRSFPMNQLFVSGGQSIGASASLLPLNIQGWFPLRLTGLISLQFKGLSRVFSNTTVQKISSSVSAFFMVQISHPCMTTGKTIALTRWTFVGRVMSLLFNMLSRFAIAFLPRNKHLFCLFVFNFKAAVNVRGDFGAQENKVCYSFHCFPIYLSWSDETGYHDLSFLNVEF